LEITEEESQISLLNQVQASKRVIFKTLQLCTTQEEKKFKAICCSLAE
jgi:hypothetical protein